MLIQGLGDIWLLVQAGTIVIQKLHAAATTAPQEVKDLIDDAAAFKALLGHIDVSIQRRGAVLKQHDDVKAAIVQILRRCEDMLNHLERIANSYESIVEREGKALGDDRRRKQWLKAIDNAYRAYRRVRWTTEDGALRELRLLLHEHEARLQTVMSSLSMEAITQILERQKQTGGQIDFIQHTPSSPALRPPQSESTSPGNRSPVFRAPFVSPLIAGQMSTSPTLSPSQQRIPNPSPPHRVIEDPPSLSLSPIRLPSPIIDPYDYNFPDTPLDLKLHDDFTIGNDLPYAKQASEDETSTFVNEITMERGHVQIPVESVTFVFQLSPTSTSVTIIASDAGRVLLLKDTLANSAAVTDIWTLNKARTVRMRHRLPIYDDIIPYPFPLDERSASIDQGFALSFVTLEGQDRETHSIPTTWVTYRFGDREDCCRFQEHLYGWDLPLIVPVKEIYREHFVQDDERLTGSESIRIWKKESESEVKFMVHLEMKTGRRKYLEFDLCQDAIKVETKGRKTLQLQRINAAIDEPTFDRRNSTTTLSTVSSRSSRSSISSIPGRIMKRFSRDDSPNLEEITIGFRNDTGSLAINQLPPLS